MPALSDSFMHLLTAISSLVLLLFITMLFYFLRKRRRCNIIRRDPVLGERGANFEEEEVDDSSAILLESDEAEPVVGKQLAMDIDAVEDNESEDEEDAEEDEDDEEDGDEVISLYLLAEKNQPYAGYELLQSLLSVGFRYGENNIFHWHKDNMDEKSEVLFSLAQAVFPGTFDLEEMGATTCKGLVMFMDTENENSRQILKQMLEVAENLIEELGGVLCDKKQQPVTEEMIAVWHQALN